MGLQRDVELGRVGAAGVLDVVLEPDQERAADPKNGAGAGHEKREAGDEQQALGDDDQFNAHAAAGLLILSFSSPCWISK